MTVSGWPIVPEDSKARFRTRGTGLCCCDSPILPVPPRGVRIVVVVLFFEILLILAAVLITWFGVYTLYRLVTDES